MALAQGAIDAGCRFYFGYPITPQNDIPEYLSAALPAAGGTFIQAESELASINMVLGAAAGGQMAPTTLPGQKTTTTPKGRQPAGDGYPIKVAELIGSLEGTAFSARVSCHDVKHIRSARKMVNRAFQAQVEGRGFALIELLSACPTNWRMTPKQSQDRLAGEMIAAFPLGVYNRTRGRFTCPVQSMPHFSCHH